MKRLMEKTGVFGVGDGLALGNLADQPLAALGEANHRRSGAGALLVGDDGGLAASMTATTELVVPRSIPIIFPMLGKPPENR